MTSNRMPIARDAAARVLSPLDRARSAALLAAARTPLFPWVARRDARASARAIVAIAIALVVAIVRPAFALAVSPAIFGVPHIAASVRYLVLRRRLPRAFAAATAALAVLMMGLRVLEQYGGAPARFARAEAALAAVWALVAAFAGARASRAYARFTALGLLLVTGGTVAILYPTVARLAFVHVHNLGAPLLWLVAFRRGRMPVFALAALFGSLALLLCGVTAGWTEALGGRAALGVDLVEVGRWLVPGAAATVAIPLVLAHAFTDSVHYTFWLGVIPDEALRGEGTLSFRNTWRGLVNDFGRPGLALVAALTLVVLGASIVDLGGTRSTYFAIAGFHGYIEGAMLIYLLALGSSAVTDRDPRRSCSSRAAAADP